LSLRSLLAAIFCAMTVSAVSVPSAVAAPLGVLGASGSTGAGDGQFQGTGGVAVNESTGDVYVVDMGGNRVERFNAGGEFLDAFGSPGSGNGQFDFSGSPAFYNPAPQLAIDQSDGSVYVADIANNRIQKFSAAGVFAWKAGTAGTGDGQFSRPQGVAVDPTDGSVYVADTGNARVQKLTNAGAYVSQFGSIGEGDGQFADPTSGGITRVGVDSIGRVSVLDFSNRVQRFTTAGAFDAVIDTSAVSYITELAVDQATDHLFVGDYYGKIAEIDGTGTLVDVHPSASPIAEGTLTGLGVKAGALAYAAAKDAYDGSLNDRLFRIGAVTPSTVTLQPLTDVEGRSATVHATINPNGAPIASYQIAITTDGSNFTYQPETLVAVGDGITDIPITQTITGLAPNQFYLYNVIVKRAYNPDVTSDYDFFNTLPVAPTISDTGVVPSEVSAKLRAKVNPESLATTYRFEYGTTDSYGSSFPVTPATVGDGRSPVLSQATIAGLEPGTVYHFRVVAESSAGVTYGPDTTFTTLTPSAPGGSGTNGRAFEQVSPVEKNGFAVSGEVWVTRASPDGDAVSYVSNGAFADAQTSLLGGRYLSRRTASGWSTQSVDAPQINDNPDGATGFQDVSRAQSEDLSKTFQLSGRALTPGALESGENLYLRDNDTGARSLLFARELQPGGRRLFNELAFMGATPDLTHVVLATGIRLLPEAIGGAYAADDIYELTDGQVRLVNRLPDGTVAEDARLNPVRASQRNSYPVSADGRRIFFRGTRGQASSGPLYMRLDGTTTIPISVSQRPGDSTAPRDAYFLGASRDGSYVYFSAEAALTVGQPANASWSLYRYNTRTAVLQFVSSGVQGEAFGSVWGVSEDGTRVYFTRLETSSAEQSLAVWDGHASRIIAPLAVDDAGDRIGTTSVSSDGRFFAFETDRSLGGADAANRTQVYRYDAETQSLECASCADVSGDARVADLIAAGGNDDYAPRNVLDDGSVFFTTSAALSSRDINGKRDVYQWKSGQATLVSSGIADADAVFVEASKDGRDVFFTTAASLVAQDTDGASDIYDARLGGGFPSQNVTASAAASACREDVCQGSPTVAPGVVAAATMTFAGPDQASAPARRSVGKVSVSKVKPTFGSRASLRVRVPAAGALSISGLLVSRATKSVTKAGTVAVPIVLTAKAQSTLRRRGTVKAAVVVIYRPRTGPSVTAKVVVTFKNPKKARTRANSSYASAMKKGGR
jgi:DNA-binding beta-propeller fold protein YncE